MGPPNPASAEENAASSNYIIYFDTISDIPSLFAKAPSKREIIFLPRETFKGLEEVPKADLPEVARIAVRQYWLDHDDSIKIITGINIDETFLRRLIRVLEWFEREYELPPPFCFLINHIGRLKILLRIDYPEAHDLNLAIAHIPPPVQQCFGHIGEEDFAEEWIPDNQDEWWWR